ncbi:AAA family ATPase [Candidatus Roizmanbacteria bacterium]|nr:AAA family ATPase [Candidatus Roizmanbacteria bacterium]
MIHSFTIKNFYSFKDAGHVDFNVNDKVPDTHNYVRTTTNTRLSKLAVVIGPNASGKTNILKVIPFLKWFIVDSFNAHPDAINPIKSFLFKQKSEIEISVEFEMKGSIYLYSFVLNELQIVFEELKVKSQSEERFTTKSLFTRAWDAKNNSYTLKASGFGLPENFENIIRKNASIVASATRLNHKLSQEIGHYWQNIQSNVIEEGWVGDPRYLNNGQRMFDTFSFFHDNPEIKKQAEKLLAKFDLGLDGFEIKKEQAGNNVNLNIQTIHTINKEKIKFSNLSYESSGTIHLFMLLKLILPALKTGSPVIIDELDASLHPEMLMALVTMFIFPESNPHNAQLIFSTHNHKILETLDKYQIILVEKNQQGSSEVWRLDEVDGVRADDNYYAKYIAGAYGAKPTID